jgi:hypothetical protein
MPLPTRPAAQAGGSFIPSSPNQPELTLSSLARLVQQQSDVVSSQAELISKLHESLRTLRDSSAEESESSRARIEALETRLRPLERLSQRTTALEAASDRMKDHVESLESQLVSAKNEKQELERKMNELDLRARVRETRRPDVNVLRSSAAANAGPSVPSQPIEQVRAADSRLARRTPESSSNDSPLRRARRGAENERMPSQPVQQSSAAPSSIVPQQPAAALAPVGNAEPQPRFTRLEFTASGIKETSELSAFAVHKTADGPPDSPSWPPGPDSPSYSPAPVSGSFDAADAMQVDGPASGVATGPVGLGLDVQPGPSAPHATGVSQTVQQLGLNGHGAGISALDGPPVRVKMEPGLLLAVPAHELVHAPSSSSQVAQHASSNHGAALSAEAQDVQMSSAQPGEAEVAQRFNDQGVQTAVERSTSTVLADTAARSAAASLEQVQSPAHASTRPQLASSAVSAGRKRTYDGDCTQEESNAAASPSPEAAPAASRAQTAHHPRVKPEPEDDEVSFVSEKRPVKSAKALRAGGVASPIKLEPQNPAAPQDGGKSGTAPASNSSTAHASLRTQVASRRATPPRSPSIGASTTQAAPAPSALVQETPAFARATAGPTAQRQQHNNIRKSTQGGQSSLTSDAPAASGVSSHQDRRGGRAEAPLVESRSRSDASTTPSPRQPEPDEAAAREPQADTMSRSRSSLSLSGYASVPFNESLKRPDLCWADVKIGHDDWRIGIDFAAQYNSISPATLHCVQEKLGHTIKCWLQGDRTVCEIEIEYSGSNGVTRERSSYRCKHTFRMLDRLAVGLILLGGGHPAGVGRVKTIAERFFLKKCPVFHFPLVLPEAPPPRAWVDFSVFKAPAGTAMSHEASASNSPASYDSQSVASDASTASHPNPPLAKRLVPSSSVPRGPAERTPSGNAPVSASAASLLARLGPPEPKRRKP